MAESTRPTSVPPFPAEESAGVEFVLHPEDGNGVLALLSQIEQEAATAGTSIAPRVQVEFGLGGLDELLPDTGTSADDLLAGLGGLEGDATCGAEATAGANSTELSDDGAGMFGAASQLAVKIVFGDDESSSTPSL